MLKVLMFPAYRTAHALALLLMVATLIAGCCTKLSKEQNVEECDATGFNSSNTVWLITKTYNLNTVPINI